MSGVQPEGVVQASLTPQVPYSTDDQMPAVSNGTPVSQPVNQKKKRATTLANQPANTSKLSGNQGSKTRSVSLSQTTPASKSAQPVSGQSQAPQTVQEMLNEMPNTHKTENKNTITSQREGYKKELPPRPASKPRINYDQVFNSVKYFYNKDTEENLETFISNFRNRLQKIDNKNLDEWEQKLKNDITPKITKPKHRLPPPPRTTQPTKTETANEAPQTSPHAKQKVEPSKGDHQENQMETLIKNPNALTDQIISQILKQLEKDKTKYSIDKLITIAEQKKSSWDYIIEHLFLNRNDPYSATDIVKFLTQGNIRIAFLKNNGVNLLRKLITLDWHSISENLISKQEQKSLLSNLAETIKSAQNSFKKSKNKNTEGLGLIEVLTNKIKSENNYHESFDINIKKKKHNFFTKLFRRLFRRH